MNPAETNPYPGLRPFDQRDSRIFFGRDDQVDDLLDRLERDRFIAVVGSSASGKSSLVRAGLLPALHGGHLAAAGSRWRIVVMRPGAAAIAALASALEAYGVLGDAATTEVRVALAKTTLESGDLGLVQLAREASLKPGENLLLVVDQFEELFRFRHDRDDAPAFVKLLLAAAANRDVPVYVLVTMRSDFLGECSQFRDLPEAISGGLFLVPRLKRDQLREAIEGPAAIAGGELEPVLVTQLLNELGDSPDQLPVLQHALMRTWDIGHANGVAHAPLGLTEFAATGGLAQALSNHGDDIYEALSPGERVVAERVFRALTDRTGDERGVRRPTSLRDLCAVTGGSREEVVAVIEAFRAPGVSFVTPAPPVVLEDATVIDISHESLMRVWQRLSGWADDEARSARTYRRIADAAELHERGAGALLIDPALTVDLAWREQNAPTAAWAERYAPGSFERAMRFLDESAAQRARSVAAAGAARRRRAVVATGVSFAVLLVLLSLGALVLLQREHGAILTEQSLELARDAQNAIDRGDPVTGELLALAALPRSIDHPDRPFTRPAHDALERAYLSRRELFDLRGHTDSVFRVSYSPDGRYIATASADTTARIWDARTGALLHVLRAHHHYMNGAAWSPDGRRFLTTSGDPYALIWDAATFRPRMRLDGGDTDLITGAWSPDGRSVLTASFDGKARIFDAATGKQRRVLDSVDGALWMAGYSRDGKRAVTATQDGIVRVWDVATGRQLRLFRHPASEWAAFSADGRRLLTVGGDHTARMWDLATGRQVYVIRGDDPTFYCGVFSPDGRRFITGSHDYTAQMRDAATGKVLFVLAGANGRIWSAAFSPDGRRVVTGSGDGVGRIWDVTTPPATMTIDVPGGAVNQARYSPGGRTIVTAGSDGYARIWDAASGRQLRDFNGRAAVSDAAFSPDGRRIVTALADGTARIWDERTGAQLLVLRGHRAGLESAVFSPDGRIVMTGSDDSTARIWNARTGAPLQNLRGPRFAVNGVAFSSDNRWIAAAGNDSSVRIYDAASYRLTTTTKQPDSSVATAAFSPDGKRLLSGSDDGTARIWDVASGAQLTLITVASGHAAAVESAAYSRDGRRIVTASSDGFTRVWDTASGAQVFAIGDDQGAIDSAAFSPDGRHVLTSTQAGVVRIWTLPRSPHCQALIDAARRSLPRTQTIDQAGEGALDADRSPPIASAFMGGEACAP